MPFQPLVIEIRSLNPDTSQFKMAQRFGILLQTCPKIESASEKSSFKAEEDRNQREEIVVFFRIRANGPQKRKLLGFDGVPR